MINSGDVLEGEATVAAARKRQRVVQKRKTVPATHGSATHGSAILVIMAIAERGL